MKEICINAYSQNFHNHWKPGGLAWYLNNEFSTERLESDLIAEDTDYYFIKHKLRSVGFLKIDNNPTVEISLKNYVELEKIYLLPDCKGVGIGRRALQEIIVILERQGKENLLLSVIDTNVSAIAFYEDLGFELHSKTTLDIPYFKDELRGMNKMNKVLPS